MLLSEQGNGVAIWSGSVGLAPRTTRPLHWWQRGPFFEDTFVSCHPTITVVNADYSTRSSTSSSPSSLSSACSLPRMIHLRVLRAYALGSRYFFPPGVRVIFQLVPSLSCSAFFVFTSQARKRNSFASQPLSTGSGARNQKSVALTEAGDDHDTCLVEQPDPSGGLVQVSMPS